MPKKQQLDRTLEKTMRQISKLPPWMQEIVLDDINTAIKNRIAIMEMISQKVTGETA